jgi:hypothetical protein
MRDRTTTITNPRKVPINVNGQRVLAASAGRGGRRHALLWSHRACRAQSQDLNDVPGASVATVAAKTALGTSRPLSAGSWMGE